MTFEYRELGTQVLLNAGEREGTPCQGQTRDDDDDDCAPCGTTECQQGTENPCHEGVTFKPNLPDKDEYRKALALLRHQLQDTLAAG